MGIVFDGIIQFQLASEGARSPPGIAQTNQFRITTQSGKEKVLIILQHHKTQWVMNEFVLTLEFVHFWIDDNLFRGMFIIPL